MISWAYPMQGIGHNRKINDWLIRVSFGDALINFCFHGEV